MQAEKQDVKPPIGLLAESSWEVCNKIGGIYTVLSTKAKVLQEAYGDNLVFIGPDVWTPENPSPYFKEDKNLFNKFSLRDIADFNIKIRSGRWDIPGSPQIILVKFDGVYPHLNSLFATMWEKFGVDSMHEYGDYREGCAFAVAAAVVIRHLSEHLQKKDSEVVAHFNEWTTGMGLLYLRLIMPEAASLFTTHATSIGRSICGNNKPLYDYFDGYNGDQMSRELNMEAKHSLEKTAAKTADCFTAVSDITAKEAAKLLDIRPQVVTPNGFEPGFVPGDKEFQNLRKSGRDKILKIAEILKGKRFKEDTLIVATSGRNEYRNKGLDIFLDSLSELEQIHEHKDVIALVLVPAWVKSPLVNLTSSGETKTTCEETDGNEPEPHFDYITHLLHNMDYDSIANRIENLERENKIGKKVNVIYVPCYLDGKDGVVNISYYNLLPAIDLTVFPSYYEPWGYTPLESIAFGVPTITSDKSGFGQWILANMSDSMKDSGVKVIERTDSNYMEAAREIAWQIKEFSDSKEKVKKDVSRSAVETAQKADWKYFVRFYYEAFQTALQRRDQRI